MNELKVTPLFSMHTGKLQQLSTPAGKLAGYSPERTGNAEIVSRQDPRCDNGGYR